MLTFQITSLASALASKPARDVLAEREVTALLISRGMNAARAARLAEAYVRAVGPERAPLVAASLTRSAAP